jgi:hypothetical protein
MPLATIHRFTGTLIDDGGPTARCESVADAAAALAHGGLAIDLRPLKAIHVDPVRRIAWVQPGATWGELDAATQEHGLAITGGHPDAGVASSTLGGGSGWLERKLGLAVDSLRAARVLTAGGHVVKASLTDNPDLFWALRGGGDGFGIVLELEFSLRPVGPTVLGGTLRWPRERAGAVIRAYRDLMAEAPDALCGGVATTERGIAVVVLYTGDAERLAPLRALAPAVDTVTPTTYCAFQSSMDGRRGPATYLDDLPDAAIDAIAAAPPDVLLQPLGGAYGRVGELDTAAGERGAGWRVRGLRLGRAAAGAERAARLAEIKERWDPDGVFG